ncbi:MAG: diaminopimelate decarboxylase [Candidatus Bathyarchaeia archaeon]
MGEEYLSSFRAMNGILHVGGTSTVEIAEAYGTPLYVVDEARIRDNYRRLKKAFRDEARIYYAAKANSNISVLRVLLEEGAYVDASSPGEIFLALKAGFKGDRIMYTGTSVSREELEYAVDKGVSINVDSISQMRNLIQIGGLDFVSVRVNPGVGSGHHAHVVTGGSSSKFGLWSSDIEEAYRLALKAGIGRFGIHMHIGSGIMEAEPYIRALDSLMDIAGRIHENLGIGFELIDIGGGFGVPYRPGEAPLDIEGLASELLERFRIHLAEKGLGSPILCVEPGRYIVCDSTLLLTRVTSIKRTPYRTFIGVDAGFNVLIRPAMYNAYHHIVAAARLDEPPSGRYDVAGPLCESGDLLGVDRSLPGVREGDLLAVLDAGAYGYSMSSQYNARPRPAEVLVKDGRVELIRRRETLRSLLKGQRIASWLE